jgi:hypothetical protein
MVSRTRGLVNITKVMSAELIAAGTATRVSLHVATSNFLTGPFAKLLAASYRFSVLFRRTDGLFDFEP